MGALDHIALYGKQENRPTEGTLAYLLHTHARGGARACKTNGTEASPTQVNKTSPRRHAHDTIKRAEHAVHGSFRTTAARTNQRRGTHLQLTQRVEQLVFLLGQPPRERVESHKLVDLLMRENGTERGRAQSKKNQATSSNACGENVPAGVKVCWMWHALWAGTTEIPETVRDAGSRGRVP